MCIRDSFGIVGVNLDQAGGGDAGKVAAVRVDQKPRAFGIDGKAEVVGHGLVQVQLDLSLIHI